MPEYEVRVAFVAEPDIMKLHVSMDALRYQRLWTILWIGMKFRDFHKALKSCESFLVLLGNVTQLQNWLRQETCVEQEAIQVGLIQRGIDNANPTEYHNGHGHQLGEGRHTLETVGFMAIGTFAAFEKAVVLAVKLGAFNLFIGEGLDHADSGESIYITCRGLPLVKRRSPKYSPVRVLRPHSQSKIIFFFRVIERALES